MTIANTEGENRMTTVLPGGRVAVYAPEDHERFVRSILSKIFPIEQRDPQPRIIDPQTAALSVAGQKGLEAWYERQCRELSRERAHVVKLKKNSATRLNHVSRYSLHLIQITRHYAFLDPLIVEFLNYLNEITQNTRVDVTIRKKIRAAVNSLYTELLPELVRGQGVWLNPLHVMYEYEKEFQRIQENIRPAAQYQDLQKRERDLKQLYPFLEADCLAAISELRLPRITVEVLAAKYAKGSLTIRDLLMKGREKRRVSDALHDYIEQEVVPAMKIPRDNSF